MRIITIVLLLVFFTGSSDAESIAARLALYKKVLDVQIGGDGIRNISGVTIEPSGGTLYAVYDNARTVFELDTEGNTLREIALQGFEDTEGIAFQSGRIFLLTEERRGNIVRVEIPETGNGPVTRNSGELFNVAEGLGNTGVEDVAWCGPQRTAYAVTEKEPKTLYRIECDEEGVPVRCFGNDPFSIEGTPGDAAGLFVCEDGTFLVCNQEENKLIGYSPEGERLSELECTMTQPEGVTVDQKTGTIYMAGEPGQLCVFTVDKTALAGQEVINVQKDNILATYPHYYIKEYQSIRPGFYTLQGRCITSSGITATQYRISSFTSGIFLHGHDSGPGHLSPFIE